MLLTLTSSPATEVVGLSTVKSHLRVTHTNDDTLITNLIITARQWAEIFTHRAFITQTWTLYLDTFPAKSFIYLPNPPLQSITWIKYTDDDDATSTFSTANYEVDTISQPGRVSLKKDKSWPSDRLRATRGVEIKYAAGYGAAGSAVDQMIHHAIYVAAAHLYENREGLTARGLPNVSMPPAAEYLLWPYRIAGYYEND